MFSSWRINKIEESFNRLRNTFHLLAQAQQSIPPQTLNNLFFWARFCSLQLVLYFFFVESRANRARVRTQHIVATKDFNHIFYTFLLALKNKTEAIEGQIIVFSSKLSEPEKK